MTGPEFRAALKALKLTQRAYAEFTGRSPATIQKYVAEWLPVPKIDQELLSALLRLSRKPKEE
jgi:hypothetical protein